MRTHDHSRRAVTALEAVFFPETFLKRMKLPILSHAFDRYDVCAVCLNRKYRARLYREPIGQDRTCATNTGSRAGFHTSAGTSPARSASARRGGTRRSAGVELPRAPRAKGFGIDSQRDAVAPECFRSHRRVHVFAYRSGPDSVYDSREVEPGFEREQGCP